MFILRYEGICQASFCLSFAMYQTNFGGPFLHPRDESDKIRLICMGRVPSHALNAGTNVYPFAVKHHEPSIGPTSLDISPRGALALIADEHHVVPSVTQQLLEVIDDSTARAHAIASDYNRGPTCFTEVVDNASVFVVSVYRDQLLEGQRFTSLLQTMHRLFIPITLKFFVKGGESASQW